MISPFLNYHDKNSISETFNVTKELKIRCYICYISYEITTITYIH